MLSLCFVESNCIITFKLNIILMGAVCRIRSLYAYRKEKMNFSHFFIEKVLTNHFLFDIILKMTDGHFEGGESYGIRCSKKNSFC